MIVSGWSRDIRPVVDVQEQHHVQRRILTQEERLGTPAGVGLMPNEDTRREKESNEGHSKLTLVSKRNGASRYQLRGSMDESFQLLNTQNWPE